MRNSFSPFAGAERPLIAFEAVIIGGSGSLRGGFFGGRLVNAAAGRARQGFIDAPPTANLATGSSRLSRRMIYVIDMER